MALRDQPYIPLYIHDIMVDEKLNECCASTHGIYIKGLMCLMHKSEEYGKILLKQKYKQNSSMCLNFAYQLSKHLPYTVEEIEKAIIELIQERVCYFEGDYLCQKRMIRDNEISMSRSKAGKKGGGNPNFVKTKLQTNKQTKLQTNYEYENEDIYLLHINKLMSFFDFNEIKNQDKLRQITFFINIIKTDDKLDYFSEQFDAYIEFKIKSTEKIHSFKNFLGTIEERFLNGGWNERNWVAELKKLDNPKKILEPVKGMRR